MHEEKAELERERKVRCGLTYLLEDVQRRLLYPNILNLNRSLNILLDLYLEDESVLFIRGRKLVHKPRQHAATALFVTFYVHREGVGVEEEEVELELLSEVVVNRWFDRVGTVVQKFVDEMPRLSILAEHDVVAEYIIFWAIDNLEKMAKEGSGDAELISVESPVWGDPRESVTLHVSLGGETITMRVPFSKVVGRGKPVNH